MTYSIEALKEGIAGIAAGMGEVRIMEVCGTHTASIRRYGINGLLPENVRLVSGPGCPVCVTSQSDIAKALSIATLDNVAFCCFGDMMRVPCGDKSLYTLYGNGYDIRLVTSPMDALDAAVKSPDKQIVYFGIGFETTAPLTAALIEAADGMGIDNLSVLSTHKTMPAAIRKLLGGGSWIDGLMCPGHVATITGSDAFSFVADELGLPAAVAGFGAEDIMAALHRIIAMIKVGEKKCVNMYPRAVTTHGNTDALSLMDKIFEPTDARWRGLGEIEGSGLGIRPCWSKYDASSRFEVGDNDAAEAPGCICASILQGRSIPTDCPNFGTSCTPDTPLGACMVSSEGSCASYYRYS